MTKCKECDLYEENKLLRENLNITQHFHEGLGMKWTKLRVKMRAWGEENIRHPNGDSRIVSSRIVKDFWEILGEETPAERFEKDRILEDVAQKEKKENE